MSRVAGKRQHALLNCALLATACIGGFALLLWVTPNGIGLYYDSMPYLESAQNFTAGLGMGRLTCGPFKPLTRYPPLYPLVLAALHTIGVALPLAARLVSGLALGLVSALAGASVWRATHSRILMLLASGWVLGSASVLSVFSWAMSEPLYAVLWLSSLLTMAAYLQDGRRHALLAAAGLAGLALLTRYVGSLPILGCAIVLAVAAARRQIPGVTLGSISPLRALPS
jgi:hypothetical protein